MLSRAYCDSIADSDEFIGLVDPHAREVRLSAGLCPTGGRLRRCYAAGHRGADDKQLDGAREMLARKVHQPQLNQKLNS